MKINLARKLSIAGTLAFSVMVLPNAVLAANKLIVKDAAGNVDKMSVTDTGYIGVGHSAPTSAIHAIGGASPREAQLMLQHNPPNATTSGGGGILLYYNNNGGLPSSAGERLGYVYFGSYDGTTQKNAAGLRGNADGPWTSTSTPSAFLLETTPAGATTRLERVRIDNAGNVGINAPGMTLTSKLQVVGLPAFANNAAAKASGLSAGAFYRTGGDPDLVCVVH